MKMSIKSVAMTAGMTVLALTPGAVAQAVGYGGGGGGGGGGCYSNITPPAGGFRLHINNDADKVTGTDVQLTIDGGNADRMAISNDPSFTNAGSEPYSKTKGWKLPGGNGEKVVYVKLYDNCGNPRSVFSDSVALAIGGTVTTPTTPSEGRVLGEKITAIDELIAKLKYGVSGADVVTLQDELKKLGFFPASVKSTGWFGPITLRAVNAYKLSISGTVSQPTATPDADLDTLVSSLKYNDRGTSVAALQTKLRALGFFPSWVRSTGWFGPITQGAVNKYLASKAK